MRHLLTYALFESETGEVTDYTLKSMRREYKYLLPKDTSGGFASEIEDNAEITGASTQEELGRYGLEPELLDSENFDDLQSDLRGLGLTLTQEEERMVNFLKSFGNDELTPSDFAEYLYDYYYNPEEYDIDEGGEYYDQISDYFDEISNCTRFNFGGPMGHGNFQRWNESCIRSSDVFKTYTKVIRMI